MDAELRVNKSKITTNILIFSFFYFPLGFAEDLYLEEVKNVVNIDFSEKAIKVMDERYKSEMYEEIQLIFKTMDVTQHLEFEDNEFDVIFDKATLDSILCGENALPLVVEVMKELHRVLKVGGVYIIVSNANEENRKNLFDEQLWEYQMLPIEKPNKMFVIDDKETNIHHFIYILTKKPLPEEKKEETPEEPVEEKKEEVPPTNVKTVTNTKAKK